MVLVLAGPDDLPRPSRGRQPEAVTVEAPPVEAPPAENHDSYPGTRTTSTVISEQYSEETHWSGPVVVGVDGSHGSDVVLRSGADQARRSGSELLVLLAWERPQRPAYAGGADALEDVPARAQEVLDRVVGKAQESGALAGLDVRAEIREGPPERVLHEAAAGAGLLVLGTRGHGGGLPLGTVTKTCAGFGLCPVIVIPTHGRDRRG